jgi:hypothetical protein
MQTTFGPVCPKVVFGQMAAPVLEIMNYEWLFVYQRKLCVAFMKESTKKMGFLSGL